MENTMDKEKAPATPEFAPSVIDQIMARASTSSQEGPGELRGRGCTVMIVPEQCRPGYLTEPIKVGISELTSNEELDAYREFGGIKVDVNADGEAEVESKEASVPQQALAVSLAKGAIRTVNDRKLTRDERRVMWEILGMTGRLALGMAYMAHCSGAAGGFLERSMASIEVW